MNSFLQKLIDNTSSGSLDSYWKYADGTKTYTFIVPKHYLYGMNFSKENNVGMMIFPNGFGVNFGKADMNSLQKIIDISLERTVDDDMKEYSTENPDMIQVVEPVSTEEKPDDKTTDNKPSDTGRVIKEKKSIK